MQSDPSLPTRFWQSPRRVAAWLLIATAYTAHFWLVFGDHQLDSQDWLWIVLMGAGWSGPALLGMWAALSPRPLWLRVPNSLLLVLSVVAIFFWARTSSAGKFLEGLVHVLVFSVEVGGFLGAWLLFSALRKWGGWRISAAKTLPPPPKKQVALAVLFLETLAVGVVLALMRLAPPEFWKELWDPAMPLVVGIAAGLIALACVPLALLVPLVLGRYPPRAPSKTYRVVTASVWLVCEVILLAYLFSENADFRFSMLAIHGAYGGAIVTLRILHAGGYRLLSVKQPLPAERVPMPA